MATEATSFRSIRVFVSSTFRDMQLEREELVKQVFPVLRRMCESRGVAWSEVDLRWGVTDEQKAEGAVLPICLAEIDRSRPFFIGLLGQRYGWVPEALPEGLADQLPWLADLEGTSVTEMEILHGVLNDPQAAEHAFFYTRDPAWVDARPPDERLVLGEVETDDEVATLGEDAAAAAAASRRERLEQLKARVAEAGLSTWQYPDPRQLGERVLADFAALVDRLFPEHEVPDALDRDAEAHRAFGHAQTLGQIDRPALRATLDGFAMGSEPPLVLAGEAGSATSAVLSAWIETWRTAHPDDVVVEHHVGATADASEWTSMAGRLIGELSRAVLHADAIDRTAEPDGREAPSDPAGRRAALFAALATAGDGPQRTVIVVDGADLLSDADGARSLTWLPRRLPANVRVVVGTAGPDAGDEARRRGWPVLTLPALDESERRAFIATFLGRYSKGLDEVHVARLVAAPATGNALYLRTVLDELRQHGDHFTLGEMIEH
ncbi:MAG: tetratricopeptide repeat domain containing protein, partial [Ilumatobacteraceae bacterium]|nr:tetratricopeptide repeat domain containing protein [Ilumatobacteraceae bacterium]